MNNPEENGYIVVPRDYSKDANITTFSTEFPKKLSELGITDNEFRHTIITVNAFFKKAESLSWTSFFEGCLGCISLFSIFLCVPNQYERILKDVDKFIAEQNDSVYKPKGVLLLNPINNGLLELEFKLLD